MTTIGEATLLTEVSTNLSIATSVMMLDKSIGAEEIVKHIDAKMHSDSNMFQRFRSVVTNGEFVEVADFSAQSNVVALKHLPKGVATPMEYAQHITNTGLKPSLPLWEVSVIEDFNGTSCCIWRIHHCIGDGMSLVAALAKLSDGVRVQSPKTHTKKKKTATTTTTMSVFYQVLWALAVSIRKLVLLACRSEPQTMLKRPGGTEKQLRYNLSLTVEEAKSIGKRHGGATLNDVMLACITGGIRSLLNAHQPELLHEDLILRAAIPVDMRGGTSSSITQTNNIFSTLLIDLPVGCPDAKERLRRVQQSTQEAKYSFEKHFLFYFGKCCGWVPTRVLKGITNHMTRSLSIAVSNVRGPPETLSFCGRTATLFAGFVPPPPSVNVGLVVFSMGNQLGVTLSSDKTTIKDPDQLMADILAEFNTLKHI